MTDNRQSLSDLASLTQQPAPATTAAPAVTTDGEAPAAPVQVLPTTPLREQILDKFGRAYATGRRKDEIGRAHV